MTSYIKKLPDMHRRSEKNIERHLRIEIEKRGGICLKFSSMTETGYPDRLVLMPHGLTSFVELKSKGEKPTRLQQIRHERLRSLGFPVFVIDNIDAVDKMIESYGV